MSEIVKVISNPAWWFTTVVVAMFVSAFAGPFRDWVFKQLSRTHKEWSTTRRRKRFNNLRHIAIIVQELKRNPAYQISYTARVLLHSILCCAFLILFSVLALYFFVVDTNFYDYAKESMGTYYFLLVLVTFVVLVFVTIYTLQLVATLYLRITIMNCLHKKVCGETDKKFRQLAKRTQNE